MAITTAQQRRRAVWQSLPAPDGALDTADRREILWQYGVPVATHFLGMYGTWRGEPVIGGTWHGEPVIGRTWHGEPVIGGHWIAASVESFAEAD
jgi:hypothetical protein